MLWWEWIREGFYGVNMTTAEGEVPQRRRIRKYERRATRLLLIAAAIVIAFIVLMMFAVGR